MDRLKIVVLLVAMAAGVFAACKKSGGSSSGGSTSGASNDGTYYLSVGADGGGVCATGFGITVTVSGNGTNMASTPTNPGISSGGKTNTLWQANTDSGATDNCLNGSGTGPCATVTSCTGTWTWSAVNSGRTAAATFIKQ